MGNRVVKKFYILKDKTTAFSKIYNRTVDELIESFWNNTLNKEKAMKKLSITVLILTLIGHPCFSQIGPEGRFYLRQTPPGIIPERFKLSVNPGSFAAERLAISNNGKEVYYTEVKSYYPATGDTIKYYRYSGRKWKGPYILFQGYLSPSLSVTGDTMFFQTAGTEYETYMAFRKGKRWSHPQRILMNLNSAHYLQITRNGNYYVSSRSSITEGGNDWCKIFLSNLDTVAGSLGRPLNTEWDNLDFFIAKDESFLITARIDGLAISYPKTDGSWTSPRSLGEKINFGLSSWGPFVTADHKYLFYTTGTKSDYSDTGIFWVRIDNLIDSLKHTNNVPYLKERLENRVFFVNQEVDFTIPKDAFVDDDGENTFSHSAILNTGQPLPDWLKFDKITGRFYGSPSEAAEYTVMVSATDKENATGLGVFKLTIKAYQT